MRPFFSTRFTRSLKETPPQVQRAFYKQLRHLLHGIRHPSLYAKKYDETHGIWQARVDGGWRFYFTIGNDVYYLVDIIPHPK